ncbi:unnamed protein product [Diatraea saccharalis]|uniref:Uncharacterized protein n=1 Tax=Diatraea saccharalis TaxID=40085 RepID=A0A9N9N0E8_9NEOP|nr:unnamed protein product [Diatraea saccharalis]
MIRRRAGRGWAGWRARLGGGRGRRGRGRRGGRGRGVRAGRGGVLVRGPRGGRAGGARARGAGPVPRGGRGVARGPAAARAPPAAARAHGDQHARLRAQGVPARAARPAPHQGHAQAVHRRRQVRAAFGARGRRARAGGRAAARQPAHAAPAHAAPAQRVREERQEPDDVIEPGGVLRADAAARRAGDGRLHHGAQVLQRDRGDDARPLPRGVRGGAAPRRPRLRRSRRSPRPGPSPSPAAQHTQRTDQVSTHSRPGSQLSLLQHYEYRKLPMRRNFV